MPNSKVKRNIEQHGMLAGTLHVDIVSAEQAIFSGRAKVVVISAEDGELGIYPGHAQLLSAIKPGHVRLIDKDSSEKHYYVSGGFIEVQPDVVTILADTVLRAEDIDEGRALEAKERAEQILASGKKLDNYHAVLIELTKALAKLQVLKHTQHD
jgi:F-type H+-transporting ATPase subunit epsilon